MRLQALKSDWQTSYPMYDRLLLGVHDSVPAALLVLMLVVSSSFASAWDTSLSRGIEVVLFLGAVFFGVFTYTGI